MKHFLNGNAVGGTLIDEPSGSAGIYFEKVRSRRFRGMLRNNIGRVRGVGEIFFEEPLAIQILESAYAQKSVDAEVSYQMIDDTGAVLIDAEINFANIRRRRNGWSVTLRDAGLVETLDLQADTFVSIIPNKEVTLSPITLAQEKTHEIADELARVSWNIPGADRDLAHYPAWKAEATRANATGDFATITNVFQQQPIWRNTTAGERRLQVTARITVSCRSSVTTTGRLVLFYINGNEVVTFPATSIVIGDELESQTYALDKVLNVPSGGDLYLRFQDFDEESPDFEFNYDTSDSYLCVNQDVAIASSTAKAISIEDALKGVASRLTPTISITNLVEDLKEDWITNGLQLRGIRTATLKTSFGSLWDDANRMYSMVLYRNGADQLTIKEWDAFLSGLGNGVVMRDVSFYEFAPSPELLSNRIRVGYNLWQSYTPTGREEIYGNEEYITGLQKVDGGMDLVCKSLCASEKLIESVRRLQFDWGGNKTGNDESSDEQLFVKGRAITPKDMLRRWESSWAVSSTQITKSTGSPDDTEYVMEGQSHYFTGEAALVQGVLTGEEWATLGDVLTFYDGGQRWRVLVNSATFRPGSAGSGAEANTIVEGWVFF